jgi:hypothetical protein
MSRKRRMAGTAVYGTVRTVVREDGGREPSSYPIVGLGITGCPLDSPAPKSVCFGYQALNHKDMQSF